MEPTRENITNLERQLLQATQRADANQELAETAQQKIEMSASRSISSCSMFKDKVTWRSFKMDFDLWASINKLDKCTKPFQKNILLSKIQGDNKLIAKDCFPGGTDYVTEDTWQDLTLKLNTMFVPPEQGKFAIQIFKTRIQKKDENVATYIANKMTLFNEAYKNVTEMFEVLKSETIDGLYNKEVRMTMRGHANISTPAELRTQAMAHVGAERENVRKGDRTPMSYAGLSLGAPEQEEEQVDEIKEAIKMFLERNCGRCGKPNHSTRECRTKIVPEKEDKQGEKEPRPKVDPQTIMCFTCQEPGHFSAGCPQKPPIIRKKPKQAMAIRTMDGEDYGEDSGDETYYDIDIEEEEDEEEQIFQ